MLITKEAAHILGVSPRRIWALVESGVLEAQRLGRTWAIDEASVRARADNPVWRGRPRKGEKSPLDLGSFLLMNRDHAVARFEFSKKQARVTSLDPLEGEAWAPSGACSRPEKIHPDYLSEWIAARSIPDSRPHFEALLGEEGYANAADLAFSSLGLSLSDQYWFQPVDAETKQPIGLMWRDLNYFDNGFDDVTGKRLMGVSASRGGSDRSPSNTTNGMLEKRWVMREGKPALVKGATPGQGREPYSELLATKLLRRLLDPKDFVPYDLIYEEGRPYSICPDMVDGATELIPAADIVSCYNLREGAGLYDAYVEVVSRLAGRDVRQSLDKMIVCDYLMSNDDRHLFNFGVLRDVESRQVIGAAPLYDNGCAFFARAGVAQLRASRYHYTAHPFSEMPLRQLALASDYTWFDPDRLVGFIDEVTGTLSENDDVTDEFVELAAAQVARSIETVRRFAEECR